MVSSDGIEYSISVKTTWEYPQGYGRVRGFDDWPRDSEGRVECTQDIYNPAYLKLLDEIERFEDWMMTQPRELTAREKTFNEHWDAVFGK
jgi:hypothetical protein